MNKPYFLIFFILSSLCLKLNAAPIPATSSSKILGSQSGLYMSELGFRISAENTTWVHTLPPEDNPYLLTEYRSPRVTHGVQSALTVRKDKLKKNMTLKSYMKKWLKDYPRFGFKILNSKPIKVNHHLGYLMDIYNNQNKRQLRQVVFLKDKLAVILTCRAHRKNFGQDVKSCNRIIKNFNWTLN